MKEDGKSNWTNRTLFHGDNLNLMRSMNSRSVHLIATDPPFNKGRDFFATPESLAEGASFQDRWRWDEDVHPDWIDSIQDDWPAAWAVVDWTRLTYGDDMAAFLCFMAVRLMAMHRILRDDGSIYLHCDPTASHYLKTLMDAIFGRRAFQAHITWQRYGSHNDARKYARVSDHILFYARPGATWKTQMVPLSEASIARSYRYEDERGRYTTSPLQARSLSGGGYEYEWRGIEDVWKFPEHRLNELDARNEIHWPKKGKVPRRKVYLVAGAGKPAGDVMSDIAIAGKAEQTGYPTQKPLALYQRLIRASSNPGDIVFDPFAGCATTPVAAEIEGRQWIAADLWEGTKQLVADRLASLKTGDGQQLEAGLYEVQVRRDPLVRSDAGETEPRPLFALTRTPRAPTMKRQEMIAALVRQHGIQCQGCYRTFDSERYLELDHMLPRSDGGSNELDNRCLLCTPCNRTKSNKLTLSGLRAQNKKDRFMAG